jgi:hypothetical protein
MEREETDVAQALATSSVVERVSLVLDGRVHTHGSKFGRTSSIVVSIQQSKECANGKDVGVVVENHLG